MTQGPKTRIGAWLARPLASFHLVVTAAVMLTVLGLVMVLSASSVEAYAADKSAYSMFLKQAMFAALGFVLFYIALRVPIRAMRTMSFPIFVTTVLLLVAVLIPGIGTESQGTRGWFVLGPLSVQPSELAKIAFAIWGAHVLASRRGEITTVKELVVPLVPAALVVFVLIILQPDLGTTVSLIIILFALLWYGGLPVKLFLAILGTGVAGVAILALTAGYRSDRVKAFFDSDADPQGTGYQARQAMYSLADGGLFGRGLGQSVAKWSYLPNAHNDFIFAIIGEELGFVGGAAVIGLFALFVYTGLRIAARSADPFLRILVAAVTTWITGQAFINIGYVVGLLPVTGLQLPLVSAGGTSTATTLFMFGVVANAARHEPQAIAALASGQESRFSKFLRLPKPVLYHPVAGARQGRPPMSARQIDAARSRAVQGERRALQARGTRPRTDANGRDSGRSGRGNPAGARRRAGEGQNGSRRQASKPRKQDPREVRERGIRR